MITYHESVQSEDARTQARRRLQQRRCLVCGARQISNGTSYFCAAHVATHRYCSTCETLRTAAGHGKDSRCKPCASARSRACYHANADRNMYRHRLRQIQQRQFTRSDMIFASIRQRIALAALVAATPGWSWRRRAAVCGADATRMAARYRRQCAGTIRDPDAPDFARPVSQYRGMP